MDKKTTDGTDTVVVLPSSLTIDTVEKFIADLAVARHDAASSLTLDASALTTITTPGIQALLCLHKTAQQQGGRLAITHFGEIPMNVCQQIGIGALAMEWAQPANQSPHNEDNGDTVE